MTAPKDWLKILYDPEMFREVLEAPVSICTLCAKVESSGFYTGCMIQDGIDCNGWKCDGNGHLTREATPTMRRDHVS